jgi:hypothetical protein
MARSCALKRCSHEPRIRNLLYSLTERLPPKGNRSQGFSFAVRRYPSGSAKTKARPNGLS